MTKLEEFRSNANHIKAWNDFVETETGKAFTEVINESVLKSIKREADRDPHGAIFHAGKSAGAAYLQNVIKSLHAQEITEEERKDSQTQQRALSGLLPSQRAAVQKRLASHGNQPQ